MGNNKCISSFYLLESVAPQAFYIDDQIIYYFDKTNKYEGRFRIKDSCGERSLYQIDEGYGIFDNKGNMYIFNLNIEAGTTKYSKKNCRSTDFEIEGIFYDIKVDEDENYIMLGNNNGKTIIRLSDENYNEKRTIIPQGMIFGSSIFVNGEYIYLGAVGEDDRLKIFKMNYIGGILESYDIDIKSTKRIISRIEKLDNYLIMLISGKRESIVIYDLVLKSTREIYINQLGLSNAFDICISKNNIAVLSERKIVEFELKELCTVKIPLTGLSFNISTDTGMYAKIMYSVQLYECIYKYFYISFFISILEYLFLNYYKIIYHYTIFEIIAFITLLTLIISYCFGIISSILYLSKKYNRIEKLLYIFSKKYSKGGVYLTSILNSIALETILMLILLPKVYPGLYLLSGILIFAADVYMNHAAKKKAVHFESDIIVELLEDNDMQVKKYIKNLSEDMNRDNINTLRINIVSDRNIESDIGALWLKSREFILKKEINCSIKQNNLTAMMDLSCRDIKYSRYNIIMDFICYVRLKTRVKELKIEIVDHNII